MVRRNAKVLVITNSNCALDSTFEKINDSTTVSKSWRVGYQGKVSDKVVKSGRFRQQCSEVLPYMLSDIRFCPIDKWVLRTIISEICTNYHSQYGVSDFG